MIYLILLIVGNILVETSGLSLNCTNDFKKLMSCSIDEHNCSGLKMILHHTDQTGTCSFFSCGRRCCCSTELLLIPGDEFLANILKDEQSLHTETINVIKTIKPPAPSITSVVPLKEVYQVEWQTNAKRSIRDDLKATVTYQKKGDSKKISEEKLPSAIEDRNFFLMNNLEPSTTYVVSVRTFTSFDVFSDVSNETEFTTASSTNGALIAIIICLSVVAIVVTSLAFASFVKVKGKLWDKAAKVEKPKLLDFRPNKKVILTPEFVSVYSLSVDPLVQNDSLVLSKESLADSSGRSGQTSGISSASCSLDYANTEPIDSEAHVLEALANAFPMFTATEDIFTFVAEDIFPLESPTENSGTPPPLEHTPMIFNNETYLIPESSPSDVEMPAAEDSGYRGGEGVQDLVALTQAPVLMETDMSYRPWAPSREVSCDSQDLLPEHSGYQDFGRLAKESDSTSPVENVEECQALMQSLANATPNVYNDIIVDHSYQRV